jgi:predicted DNA-binding transcriptional regulator YafY
MSNEWKPPVLGDDGWSSFEDDFAKAEAEKLRHKIAAARFQATGQAPEDHVVDLSASSDPYLTADQFIALQTKNGN